MPVEEQTLSDKDYLLYNGLVRKNGQRLTIPNRTVTKLAFYVHRVGSPTGNVHFAINRITGDEVIIDEVVCTANVIGLTDEWREHEWSAPPTINEEVRIYAYVEGGGSADCLSARYQDTDVKGGEYRCGAYATGWFEREVEEEDTTYRYTYEEPPAVGLENKSAGMAAKMVAEKLI